MKPILDKTIGPELHRIKPLDHYDNNTFVKLYKLCRPVIRNIVKTIDCRRYNVSKDILTSYFWDKMLFLFNRYYNESNGDFEFLKAHILKGLNIYKYHLLHDAYSERSEWFQSLTSLDTLFDNNKEDVDFEDDDTNLYKEKLIESINKYMQDHLSPDALLVFECLINPTEFFLQKTDNGKHRITNKMLVEFFNLPMNKYSIAYIGDLRRDIEYWEQKARVDLKHK